jgi:phytanoyl-CoA hydroxylase
MPHIVEGPVSTRTADLNKTKFFVNDGLLEPSEISSLRPSDPSLPLDELRKRYNDDGYLFLKGLLPRADVLKAREAYFNFLSPTGVLQPDTSPVEGIYDSAKDVAQFPGIGSGAAGMNGHPGEGAAEFVDLALRAHGEKWYAEDFCKHPLMLEFIGRFTGWAEHTIAFRRTLLRNNIPGTKAIGVHYDQIFLRYGEPTSVTAWVPMGDISLTGGGLIYLENGIINLMSPF